MCQNFFNANQQPTGDSSRQFAPRISHFARKLSFPSQIDHVKQQKSFELLVKRTNKQTQQLTPKTGVMSEKAGSCVLKV
jgi:hypothetical protein